MLEETNTHSVLTSFFIFILTFLVVYIFQTVWRWRSLPPGPWGLPIIGHLHIIGDNAVLVFLKMAEKYGDVFYVRMGSWQAVVLNSRDAIREALVDQADVFSDRPGFMSMKIAKVDRGLAFGGYCQRWKLQKKIALSVMRDFTSTRKSVIEQITHTESNKLVQHFRSKQGTSFDPFESISLAVGNIMYKVCYGIEEDCRNDKAFLAQLWNREKDRGFAGCCLIDLMPWMRFFMPWKTKLPEDVIEGDFFASVRKGILNDRETFDENHLRHIADGVIHATNKYCVDSDKYHGITHSDIYIILNDLLGGGFDTTAGTLEWITLYLGHHKDVQQKVQTEIDAVLNGRIPEINDMGKLPFTEATILEVMRMSPIAPITIAHATSCDTLFRNFRIEKGSIVFINLYAAARDSKIWEQPMQFLPERFLDEENKIIQEKVDALLLFGAGRRRCPGDYLARVEVFLFTVSIFQNCTVDLAAEADFTGMSTLLSRPKPFSIVITSR